MTCRMGSLEGRTCSLQSEKQFLVCRGRQREGGRLCVLAGVAGQINSHLAQLQRELRLK